MTAMEDQLSLVTTQLSLKRKGGRILTLGGGSRLDQIRSNVIFNDGIISYYQAT